MSREDSLPSMIRQRREASRFVGFTGQKIPINPRTGRTASVNNPGDWGSWSDAANWARRTGQHVGYVSLDQVIIDCDGAITDGEIHPWVVDLIESIGCDVDISVTGTGVHLYPEVIRDAELAQLLSGRKVFKHVPIRQVELRAGFNSTILQPVVKRATKAPTEQTAALKSWLRQLGSAPAARRARNRRCLTPEREATAVFHAALAGTAKRRGQHGNLITGALLKYLDPQGQGFLDYDDARRQLAQLLAPARKHPDRAANRMLELFCASPFGQRRRNKDTGRDVIALVDPRHVAKLWGIELGARVEMPLDQLRGQAKAQIIYQIIGRTRTGTSERPAPTARITLQKMSGVSASTQRRAEKRAGATVTPHYCVMTAHPAGRNWISTEYGPASRIANSVS